MSEFLRTVRVTAYNQVPDSDGFVPFFAEQSNGLEITALTVRFKIEKHLHKTPNSAEITIVNANDETRAFLQRRPLRVRIEAGYNDQPRLLFVGDLRKGSGSEYTGTEWETTLLLGDGSRAFSEARTSRAYTKGTNVKTILRDVSKAMGLELPTSIDARVLDTALAAGELTHGYAADELTRLLAPYGYEWSMQNGRLQILRYGETHPGIARVVSEDDGMIGAPRIKVPDRAPATKSGKTKAKPTMVTVEHILYPELTPGGLIEIRSKGSLGDGQFKIETVTHEGDTEDGDFKTTVEARVL